MTTYLDPVVYVKVQAEVQAFVSANKFSLIYNDTFAGWFMFGLLTSGTNIFNAESINFSNWLHMKTWSKHTHDV